MNGPVSLALTQEVTRVEVNLPTQSPMLLCVTVDRRDDKCVLTLESRFADAEPAADTVFDRAERLLRETGIITDIDAGS